MKIQLWIATPESSTQDVAVFDTGAQITLIPISKNIYFEQTGETMLIDFDNAPQYIAPKGYCYVSLDGYEWEKIPCARSTTDSLILSPYHLTKWYFVVLGDTVTAYRV